MDRLDEYYGRLSEFVALLKASLPVEAVYLFGSFATGEVHEGSDIDLVIVGDFRQRFPYRARAILDLTELPIEPLVYTREEFEDMVARGNPFIAEVLRTGQRL
ncbi:MAG: nucleotidyltransferase domain-containing protein [Chloroflexi bacterium]|nr:nucleotidyltransferase domain-containing protein [Chloroflexota bacterium]